TPEQARDLFRESLDLYRQLGDRPGIARALANVALTIREVAGDERAKALLEESLSLAREVGEKSVLADSLGKMALLVRDMQPDPARERVLLEEKLALCEEMGHTVQVAVAFRFLGWIALREGDTARAKTL